MNPFDLNAMADLWRAGGHAMLNAQKEAGRAMAEGFQALGSGTLPPELGAGSDELGKASQAMLEMWTAATGLFQTLTARLPQGGTSTAAEATLRSMMDPRSWTAGGGELDDVLARMAEGPRFADLWDNERRYARVMQAWMEVRRRGLEHNAVVLEAWMAAGRAFTEEWAGHASLGGEAPDAKAALALWTETANRKLLETQRSEPFLRTQTAMIRASTDLRMAQQELVEHVGRQFGFPTRTELDDVHRTVTELRREMRAMRRAQRAAGLPAPPREGTLDEPGTGPAAAEAPPGKPPVSPPVSPPAMAADARHDWGEAAELTPGTVPAAMGHSAVPEAVAAPPAGRSRRAAKRSARP